MYTKRSINLYTHGHNTLHDFNTAINCKNCKRAITQLFIYGRVQFVFHFGVIFVAVGFKKARSSFPDLFYS